MSAARSRISGSSCIRARGATAGATALRLGVWRGSSMAMNVSILSSSFGDGSRMLMPPASDENDRLSESTCMISAWPVTDK